MRLTPDQVKILYEVWERTREGSWVVSLTGSGDDVRALVEAGFVRTKAENMGRMQAMSQARVISYSVTPKGILRMEDPASVPALDVHEG